MSILLLLYGIQTDEADQPPPTPDPTPTPSGGGSGAGPIGGIRKKRQYPIITFNKKIERDDEELIVVGV